MNFKFELQKVLEVKENEKAVAERVYSASVKEFEDIAQELYQFLKKKEDMIDYINVLFQGSLSIKDIKQHEERISYLEKRIEVLQVSTQKARKQMDHTEKVLTSKAIELKKYEKMKEKRYFMFLEDEKKSEMKFLDEISIQSYVRR